MLQVAFFPGLAQRWIQALHSGRISAHYVKRPESDWQHIHKTGSDHRPGRHSNPKRECNQAKPLHSLTIAAPVADRLVLNFVNNRIFRPDNFYANPKDNGVVFKQDALKRYFTEYESMINRELVHPVTGETATLRKCIRIQAENMAATIQDNRPYTPFMLKV